MNSLLTSIAGQFAKPLLLSAVLPVLLVAALFQIVTNPLFPVPLTLPQFVSTTDTSWQIAWGALLTIVLAMLLFVLNTSLARLYSGYPWMHVAPGTFLVRWRRSQYERLRGRRDGLLKIYDALKPANAAEEAARNHLLDAITPLARRLNEEYPYSAELVLPTRLGNAIRNFEDYSREQYGISAVPLWPRLLAVIDSKYATVLDDAKMTFDFALNCTALLSAAAVLTLVLALQANASGSLLVAAWLRAVLFGVLAMLAYAAAVIRARNWGVYVKAAVDIHRVELMKKLGYQYTLADIADEKNRIWSTLASEWSFPDMSGSFATLPFAPSATVIAPTSVTSQNVESLRVARGVTAPAGRPYATITVTLRVQNTTSAIAQSVRVTDAVPANWSLIWGSPTVTPAALGVTLQSSMPMVLEVATLSASSSCELTYQLQSLIPTA